MRVKTQASLLRSMIKKSSMGRILWELDKISRILHETSLHAALTVTLWNKL